MTATELLRARLRAQRAVAPHLRRPADVVRWMCAVQAQDHRGALWGIGLRTTSATEADVERAVAERAIVRTWPMRGTLHFVAAEDARWMLRLLAPRVLAKAASRYRQLGLDEALLTRSSACVEAALGGGRALTRPELYRALQAARVPTDAERGIMVLGRLAMQGVLCLGEHRGRQPTFVLLEEWVRESRALEGDEARGELARRYFESHGPASLRDFAWWSGLPLGEARRGVDVAGEALREQVFDGRPCWSVPRRTTARRGLVAHLLPPYDEHTVAYRDRGAFLDPAHAQATRNGIFSAVVTLDGRIAGTWQRALHRDRVEITVSLLLPRPPAGTGPALAAAAARYGEFLGVPAVLTRT